MTAAARRTDPETSHEAARTVDVMRSQMAVLTLARQYLPKYFTHKTVVAAYQKIADQGVLPPHTDSRIRTACRELVDAGLMEHAGWTTPTTGRRERIWALTEEDQ